MATFNEVGFLSDELEQWTKNAHNAFSEAFTIAHRMNQLSMRMLWDLPTEEMSEVQVWAVAGYGRAVESFQTCILLAERGALAEARALARLCAEAVILTAGLLKVDGTLAVMHADGAKHKLKLCNRLLELNAKSGDEKALARFEAEKAKLVAEFGTDPKSLNYDSLARQAGLELLYELSYRHTSGNGAHATVAALERNMSADENGYFDGYRFGPDFSDMRSTLQAANAAMIHLIGLAVDHLGLKSYDAETRDLVLHWKVIGEALNLPD
ncbi:DUF5677 domain-containing protein [Paraburkholderia sp. WP4_3_2]|uniref:DUF5677 domain-containing protein n=1 Tax=Paraburkholderia sp. WP4_3_2 TaxID=2587162 RepID=UPI001621E19E|nr:DUF5677 domain-containing protein [Paraburkholderia sp. WP4_3_2]MBB3261283.1 hypothetical protein [Paraburkholderia sp. WP4_3_2]